MKDKWEAMTPEQQHRLITPFIEAGLKTNRKSSKIKIEVIVTKIVEKYNDNYICNCHIGKNNVDILVADKLIIECYDDYWHCNPQVYKNLYYNKSLGLTSEQKWDKDNKRNIALMSKGYTLLVLWEYDIKRDLQKIEQLIFQAIIYI